MSIEVMATLIVALLIIIAMTTYFLFRANKNDYTQKICTRCGCENLTQGEPFEADNGDTVVATECKECGFISHETL